MELACRGKGWKKELRKLHLHVKRMFDKKVPRIKQILPLYAGSVSSGASNGASSEQPSSMVINGAGESAVTLPVLTSEGDDQKVCFVYCSFVG